MPGRGCSRVEALRFSETLERGADLRVVEPEQKRMSKDYEGLCSTSESFVYAAMSRLVVRRMARR